MSILSVLKRPKKAAKKSAPWDAPVAAAPPPAPVAPRPPPKPLAISYPFYRYPEGGIPADRSAL